MAISTRKSFISILNNVRDTMNDREFFESEGFRTVLLSMVMGIAKKYRAVVDVSTLWKDPKSFVAYCTVSAGKAQTVLNLNNAMVQGLTRREMYETYIALTLHECGHLLFTDFALTDKLMNEEKISREIIGAPKLTKEMKTYGQSTVNKVVQLHQMLANCIEDGFIELILMHEFPGYGKYLAKLREKQLASMEPYDEMKRAGMDVFPMAFNLILSYSKYGTFGPEPAVPDHVFTKISSLKDSMDAARTDMSFISRWRHAAEVLEGFWEVISSEKQRQEQEQGQQNSESGESGKNDSPNTQSGQNSSERGSGSSDSSGNGENGQNSDPSDPEGCEDASGSSDSSGSSGSESGNGSSSGEENRQNSGSSDSENGKSSSSESSGSGTPDGEGSSSGSESSGGSDSSQGESKSTSGTSGAQNAPSGENEKPQGPPLTDSEIESMIDNAALGKEENNSLGTHNRPLAPNTEGKVDDQSFQKSESDSGEFEKLEKEVAKQRAEQIVEEKNNDEQAKKLKSFPKSRWHENVHASWRRAEPKTVNTAENALVRSTLRRLVSEFKKEIKERQEGGWDSGYYTGQLMGNPFRHDLKRMSKKTLPEDIPDMAFMLLIDMSGSMSNLIDSKNAAIKTRCDSARVTALLLYLFCRELDIPISVYGHGYFGGAVQLTSFAEYGSVDGKDYERLSNVNDDGGCNRDGYAIRYCSELLCERPEKQKIFMIISDGLPSAYPKEAAKADIHDILVSYGKKGVKYITAGIGEQKSKIEELYCELLSQKSAAKFFDVSNVEAMPKSLCKILKRYLE